MVLEWFAEKHPKELRKSLPVVRELLGEANTERRVSALHILREMGREAKPALPNIMALLPIASDYEKTFAAGALYTITGSTQLPVSILVEATRSKYGPARFNAAGRLEKIGRPAAAALPALICLCEDSDPAVRLAAVQTIPKLGIASAQVIKAVKARLSDKDSSVRNSARLSLDDLQFLKNRKE